jgi:MscS family membrane protein
MGRLSLRILAAAAALAALSPGRAVAQGPSPTPEPVSEAAPDSPRASLAAYLDLARHGKYPEAARYLILPEGEPGRGAELARRLKAVLDRHLSIDPDAVSPLSEGNPADGQPPRVEQVGAIPVLAGSVQPVRLVKSQDANGALWAFSRATVSSVDRWYEELPDAWAHDRLPDVLLRPGPANVARWQWAALPLLLLAAWVLGRLLTAMTVAVLGRLAARTPTQWDDLLVPRLRSPFTLAWAVIVLHLLLPFLALYAPAEQVPRTLLRVAWGLSVLWAVWRSIDVSAQHVVRTPWGLGNPSGRSLLTIGVRFGKVALAMITLLAVVATLGFPVGTVLAGLGLGGLALALAAQKTVENLIGTVTLAADQPFREGDTVRVDGLEGVVETIGLRSTRIRTNERTLVTVPNGRLADMRIESLAVRDRFCLACTLSLVYGTTAAQVAAVLEGCDRVLRTHPKIWPEVVVSLKALAPSSLDVEILAWFRARDFEEFRLCRQEALLGFMKVVEDAGTSFAFPTRTVHVVRDEDRPPPS